MAVCATCRQPECPGSDPGEKRPPAASHSTRLRPGYVQHRGYEEFAVTPEEAIFVLHRGWVILDGVRRTVAFVHNEAYVAHLQVTPSYDGEATTAAEAERNRIRHYMRRVA